MVNPSNADAAIVAFSRSCMIDTTGTGEKRKTKEKLRFHKANFITRRRPLG